jgi:hypothetical protein
VFFYLTYEGSVDLDAIGMWISLNLMMNYTFADAHNNRSSCACRNWNPNCQLWPNSGSASYRSTPPAAIIHQPIE